MWLKEENGKLVPPPKNYLTPDGWVMNFDKSPEQTAAYGWRDWTGAEIAAWKAEHPDPVITRTACTKYELVTCLRTCFPELLASLRTAYANSPDLQFWWNSVLDLDRENADFQQTVSALGITEEQLDAIFAKIGEV